MVTIKPEFAIRPDSRRVLPPMDGLEPLRAGPRPHRSDFRNGSGQSMCYKTG